LRIITIKNRLVAIIFTAFIGLSYSYSSIGGTISLHPSDIATTGGFSPSGGAWSDILDTNDGNSSFAKLCCGPGGSAFYVHLDDPSGVGSNAITGIDVYVYAKYLDGQWPNATPIAGNINIGFKTGTSTIWQGTTATDQSGAYNLIQSNMFTTDSDGGSLDLNDIINLQIAVQRNTYGPPQLRVTEVYADVHYASPVPLPSAILLFGTGLVGLATAKIRKKKI